MQQPSNVKLIEFIKNSEVSVLTSGGVNNICILLVKNNIEGYISKYIDYDFSSNTIIPLTRLCIKLVFLSGGRVKIQYGDKKSISEPLIRQEATNQNIVFKKSIAQYGKPLCPPVLSINISKGIRIDILSAILSRMKRDTHLNRKMYKDIAHFLENKKNFPIGFITMGYIPPTYKTENSWKTYLSKVSLTLAKETYYIIFKELFKLHYLGFQHCDFNPDNIMICNPIVADSTAQGLYTNRDEKLFSVKIKEAKPGVEGVFPKYIQNSQGLDGVCDTTKCIIIDFGTLRPKPFNPELKPYDILKCQGEDELLLKLFIQKFGETPDHINSSIMQQLEKDNFNPVGNNEVKDITVNNSKDKLDNLNISVCDEYIARQKALHKLVSKISDNSPHLAPGVLQQLEKLSAPVQDTPENVAGPGGLFGANNANNFAGGSRKMNLHSYLKTLTYNFSKSTKQTRKKH